MDYLDIINPKTKFTASAKYYSEPQDGPETGGSSFNYEYVNPFSNTYRRLFSNIQSSAGEVTIRTNSQLNFEVNGIVVIQNGKAFKIIQVERDYQSAPKQSLRLFGTPVGTQYVLRLVFVPNPWGIQ